MIGIMRDQLYLKNYIPFQYCIGIPEYLHCIKNNILIKLGELVLETIPGLRIKTNYNHSTCI